MYMYILVHVINVFKNMYIIKIYLRSVFNGVLVISIQSFLFYLCLTQISPLWPQYSFFPWDQICKTFEKFKFISTNYYMAHWNQSFLFHFRRRHYNFIHHRFPWCRWHFSTCNMPPRPRNSWNSFGKLSARRFTNVVSFRFRLGVVFPLNFVQNLLKHCWSFWKFSFWIENHPSLAICSNVLNHGSHWYL